MAVNTPIYVHHMIAVNIIEVTVSCLWNVTWTIVFKIIILFLAKAVTRQLTSKASNNSPGNI